MFVSKSNICNIIITIILCSIANSSYLAAQAPPSHDYILNSGNCYPKSLYNNNLAINSNFVPPPQYIFGPQNATVSPFTSKSRILIAETQGSNPVEISDCIFFIQKVQLERLSIRTILSNTDINLDGVSVRSDVDPDFACVTTMDVAGALSNIPNAFGKMRRNSSFIVRNSKFELSCVSSFNNYLIMFANYGNVTDTNFVFENSEITLDGAAVEVGNYFFWFQPSSLFCGGSVIFRNNTITLSSFSMYNRFFYIGGIPKLSKPYAIAAATPASPTTSSSDRMWGPSEFIFEYNKVKFASSSFSPASPFSSRIVQTAIFATDVLINTDLIRISNNNFRFEYPHCETWACFNFMHQPPRLLITGASADSGGSVDYPTLNLGRVEIEGNDIEFGRSITGFALWQSLHNVVVSSNNEEYTTNNNKNNNWLGIKIRNNYLHANRFAGCDTNTFRGATNCLHQFSLIRILPPNQVSPLRSFVVRKGDFQNNNNNNNNNNSVFFLIENNTIIDQSTNRADMIMMVSTASCNPISALIPAASANEDITALIIVEIGFFVVSDAVFHVRGNRIVSNVFYGPLAFRLSELEQLSTWETLPDSYYKIFCTAQQVVAVRLLPLANSPVLDSFTFNFTSSIVIEDNSIEIQPSAHTIQAEIFFLASRNQTGVLVSRNNNNKFDHPFSLINNNISFSNPKNFNNTFTILASTFSAINPVLSAASLIFRLWVDNGNFVTRGCHVVFGARERFAFAKTTATILTFQLIISSTIVESSQFPSTDIEVRAKARASAVIAAGSLVLQDCSVVMEDYLMIKPMKAGAFPIGTAKSLRIPEMSLTLTRNLGTDFASAGLSLSVNGDVVITNCLTSVTLSPDLYAYVQGRLFWNDKYNHGPDFVLPSSTPADDDYINYPLELDENNVTFHFIEWIHVRGWSAFLDNYPFRVKNFVAENSSVVFSGEGSNFYHNNPVPLSKFRDPDFIFKDSPFPCRSFAISFITILSNFFAVSNFSLLGGQVVVAGVASQKDKLNAGVVTGKFSFARGQIENVRFLVRHVVIATTGYHTVFHMFDVNPILTLVVSNSSMILDHCSWLIMQLAFVSVGVPSDDNQDEFINMANPSPQQGNTFSVLLQNNQVSYIGFSVFNTSMMTKLTRQAKLEQILYPSREVDPEKFMPQFLLPGTGAAVSFWIYMKNSPFSTFDQLQNIVTMMQVSSETDFAFFNGYQSMEFIGTKATMNQIIQLRNIIFNATANEITITADEENDRDSQGAPYYQMSLSFQLGYVDLVPTVGPASLRRFVIEVSNNRIESHLMNNNNNNKYVTIPYSLPPLAASALFVSPLAASDFSSDFYLVPNVTGRLFAINSSIIIVANNRVNLPGMGAIADGAYGAFVVDAHAGASWLIGNAEQIDVVTSSSPFSTLILPKYAYHSFFISNNTVNMTFSSCIDNVTSTINNTAAPSMSYEFAVLSSAITHEFVLENNAFVASFMNPLPRLANRWNTSELHCVVDGFSWSMVRFDDPAFTFVVACPFASSAAAPSNLFTIRNNKFEMNFEEGFELLPRTAIEVSFVSSATFQAATDFQSLVVPTVTINNPENRDPSSSCSLLSFVNNSFEMKRSSSSSSSSASSSSSPAAVILHLAASVGKVFIDKISFLLIASRIFDFTQLRSSTFGLMNFANNTMMIANLSFWRPVAAGFVLPLEISFSNLLHSDFVFGASAASPILHFMSNKVQIVDVHFVAKIFEAILRYPSPHSFSFLQIHASTISSLNTKIVVVSIEQDNKLEISSSSAKDSYPALFHSDPLPHEYFASIITLSSSFWISDFAAKKAYPKSRISFCSLCRISSSFTLSVENDAPTSINALTFVDFETSFQLGEATVSPNVTNFFAASPRSNFEFTEIQITSSSSSSSSSNNIRLFQFRLDFYSSRDAAFFWYYLPTLKLAMTFSNSKINNKINTRNRNSSTTASLFDQLPTTSFVEIRESPRFLDLENLTFSDCSVDSDIQFNFLEFASRRPTPGVQLNAVFKNNSVVVRSSENAELSSFVRFESSSYQPEKYGSQFAGSITFEKNSLKEVSTRPATLVQIVISSSPSTSAWIGSKAKLNFTSNLLSAAEVTQNELLSDSPSSLLHIFESNSSTASNSILNLGKSQWIVKCNDFKSLPYDWWLQLRSQLLAGNVDQNTLEIGKCTETGSMSHQESLSHLVTVSNESNSPTITPSALSSTKTFAETKSISTSLSPSRIHNSGSQPDSPSKSISEIFAPPALKLSQLISQDAKIPIVAASIISGSAAAFQFTFKMNSLSQLSGCDSPDDANEDDVNPNKKVVDPLEFDSNFLMMKLGSPGDGFETHRGALLGNLIIVAIAILLTLAAIIVFAMVRETSFTFMMIKIGFPSQPLAEFIYMLSPPSAAVVVVILAMRRQGNMRNEGMAFVLVALNVAAFFVYPVYTLMSVILADEGKREDDDLFNKKDDNNLVEQLLRQRPKNRRKNLEKSFCSRTTLIGLRKVRQDKIRKKRETVEEQDGHEPEGKAATSLCRKFTDAIARNCVGPTWNYLLETEHDWIALDAKEFHRRMKVRMANIKRKRNISSTIIDSGSSPAVIAIPSRKNKQKIEFNDDDHDKFAFSPGEKFLKANKRYFDFLNVTWYALFQFVITLLISVVSAASVACPTKTCCDMCATTTTVFAGLHLITILVSRPFLAKLDFVLETVSALIVFLFAMFLTMVQFSNSAATGFAQQALAPMIYISAGTAYVEVVVALFPLFSKFWRFLRRWILMKQRRRDEEDEAAKTKNSADAENKTTTKKKKGGVKITRKLISKSPRRRSDEDDGDQARSDDEMEETEENLEEEMTPMIVRHEDENVSPSPSHDISSAKYQNLENLEGEQLTEEETERLLGISIGKKNRRRSESNSPKIQLKNISNRKSKIDGDDI